MHVIKGKQLGRYQLIFSNDLSLKSFRDYVWLKDQLEYKIKNKYANEIFGESIGIELASQEDLKQAEPIEP